MATYPDDVIFNTALFTVVGSPTTYNSTGAQTDFPVSSTATHKGEIIASIDGIVQQTSLYTLANNGNSISFSVAPVATTLTLTNIAVPENLARTTVPIPTLVTEFSNTSVTTVLSNNYIINGVQTAWPVHASAVPTSGDELMVIIDGVIQVSSAFTYPSSVLSTKGIDITSPVLDFFNVLQIRAFTASDTITTLQDRCRGIIDKKPAKGFGTQKEFQSVTFESQIGYEKTRLLSRKGKRTWSLSYINVDGISKASLETFYDARSGGFESFNFDLTHLNEGSETPIVKFAGPLKWTHVQSRGTGATDNFYTIQVELKEVYD